MLENVSFIFDADLVMEIQIKRIGAAMEGRTIHYTGSHLRYKQAPP